MPTYDLGLEHVSLAFATKNIFTDVTQGVFEGDRIGIVGKNGDGKSTLLHLFKGTQEPDSGRVTMRNGLTFGMLDQRDPLDDNATVREAALEGREDYEWAAETKSREIVEALLGGISLDAKIGSLSGGQRRRADLARLLLKDWDILALDEPTNHLDVVTIHWLAEHLKNRWPSGQGALLLVTHDRWFLDEVCESMWEVHDGVIDPFEALVAHVTDAQGQPVEGASVSFRLYNYAEFYPLATFPSDAQGYTSLTSGRGDLLVWATHEGRFGFTKASVGQQDTVQVVLDKDSTFTGEMDLDLLPPPERDNMPKTTHEQRQANKVRLAQEDSLRNAYMAAAFTHDSTDQLMVKARANHQVLAQFLKSMPNEADGRKLLGTLSDKDLRDVSREVLDDHFLHLTMQADSLWLPYVASPRVSQEMLTPWRQVLGKAFAGKQAADIIRWVQDSICVDETRNPIHLCMSPLGVFRHRVTDGHSRDIFFVSAARSAGIPARINSITGQVQWADSDGQWREVHFDEATSEVPATCRLRLTYTDTDVKENPAYYTQFTLSRISQGSPRLQEFPEGSTTWAGTFSQGTSMQPGQYMMVSGTRLANGGVLAHLSFFGLPQNGTSTQALHLRKSGDRLSVIASFNCELGYTTPTGKHKSILQTVGRGYYVVGLVTSNHEPSTHVLRDMCDNNIYLCRWNRPYLLLFPSREEYDRFVRKDFDEMPDNVLFGIADPETVEAMHIAELTHGSTDLPIFMMCDTFNRVVWFRQGYSINMSGQIMDVIMQLMGLE